MGTLPLSKQWSVFLLTYFGYSVIYITRKCFSVVKTLIQDDLNLSTYILGTIDSVFLTTYAICQVFLPSLSDSYGVRPIIIASFSSAAFFSFIFSVGHSASTLVFAWFFQGVAHASVFAVFIKAVSLWFSPERRGHILGLWTTSQQIGGILATTLATYISTSYGWRGAFAAAGLITAGTATLMYYFLEEPPVMILLSRQSMTRRSSRKSLEALRVDSARRRLVTSLPPLQIPTEIAGVEGGATDGDSDTMTVGDTSQPSSVNSVEIRTKICDLEDDVNNRNCISGIQNDSEEGQHPNNNNSSSLPGVKSITFLEVLLIPGLVSCGIAYFCIKVVRYALLFWLPFFLITELDFSPAAAGYSSMMFDLGGIFGAVASGSIVKRVFKGRRLTAAAILCIAAGISLVWFAYAVQNYQQQSVIIMFGSSVSRSSASNASLVYQNQSAIVNNEMRLSTSTNAPDFMPKVTLLSNEVGSQQLNIEEPDGSAVVAPSPIVIVSHTDQDDGNSRDTVARAETVKLPVSTKPHNGDHDGFNHHPLVIEQPDSKKSGSLMTRLRHLEDLNSSSDVVNVNQKDVYSNNTSTIMTTTTNTSEHDIEQWYHILIVMALVGFFIAGPDSILGATSAGHLCEKAGTEFVLSTATGIVNGLGAFGGVAQGYLTAAISDNFGWSTLFFVLSGFSMSGALTLSSSVADEYSSPMFRGNNSSSRLLSSSSITSTTTKTTTAATYPNVHVVGRKNDKVTD